MEGVFRLSRRMWLTRFFAFASVLFFCSCASQSVPPINPIASPQQSFDSTAPVSSTPTQPLFYDFPDIPVPHELAVQRNDSYVYQEGKIRAGILTFRGRVEAASLIRFFQMELPRKGWIPKGGFRYRRSMLLFEKVDKICVIDIYEKFFFTYVEIYVLPAAEVPKEKG